MRKVFMTNVLMATVLGIATAFANRYRFLALSFTILQLDKCATICSGTSTPKLESLVLMWA